MKVKLLHPSDWKKFKDKYKFDPKQKAQHQIVLGNPKCKPKFYPAVACVTEQVYMTQANELFVTFVYPSDFVECGKNIIIRLPKSFAKSLKALAKGANTQKGDCIVLGEPLHRQP